MCIGGDGVMSRIRKPPVMTGPFAQIVDDFIIKEAVVLNMSMSLNVYPDSAGLPLIKG